MILQDWTGLNKDRDAYLARFLHALSKGPQTEAQLNEAVGNAGIRRAAGEVLRIEGKIYDSWDMTQPYEKPFRYYLRSSE